MSTTRNGHVATIWHFEEVDANDYIFCITEYCNGFIKNLQSNKMSNIIIINIVIIIMLYLMLKDWIFISYRWRKTSRIAQTEKRLPRRTKKKRNLHISFKSYNKRFQKHVQTLWHNSLMGHIDYDRRTSFVF